MSPFVAEQGGPVLNGLLKNLVGFWPLNEVNGNALDLHTNALHLTDTNTVTSNPGIIYPLARQYTAANLEYHTRASESILKIQNKDATFMAWVRLDSLSFCGIISKAVNGPGASWDYYLSYDLTRFVFSINSGGGDVLSTFGPVLAGVWYCVFAWFDASGIHIQVNDTQIDDTAYVAMVSTNENFFIGTRTAQYMNGRIGPAAFWSSATGAGGALTAAQRLLLYNNGAGLPYAQFTR